MNQWIRIAILTGAVALTTTSIAWAKFSDMTENTTYEKAISDLVEDGILNGYPDNTFRPDGKITRAEFAKILFAMEDLKLKEDNQKEFEDVANHWAKTYIEIAASNNLLKGYEDNTFKPEREITYGEIATILLRVLDIYEINNSNTNWPDDCMEFASDLGLFDGVETNDLIGMNPARRDNAALMIWNTINYKNNHNILPSGDNISGDEEKEETNNSEKVNTKAFYIGSVEKITSRRGENYITIKNIDGEEEEIKLYSKSAEPKLKSFIVYKLTSSGQMNLQKELLVSDIDNVAFVVEDVDDELITLQDEENILDLQMTKYESSTSEVKLTKYTYYLVEMAEEEGKYVFDSFDTLEFGKLKLKKEDRLCFDEDTKIALVIRGIEN